VIRRGRNRLAVVAGAAALTSVVISGCGSSGLNPGPLEASIGPAFARLYVLQQVDEGNPRPSAHSLDARANCQKGGTVDVSQNGPGVWVCEITYLVAGPGYPVIAKYNVDVQTDGCYAADGDGPASVNGSLTVTGPGYQQVTNPLTKIVGCFDVA
jgi:ABC-2 type transport system permease protein